MIPLLSVACAVRPLPDFLRQKLGKIPCHELHQADPHGQQVVHHALAVKLSVDQHAHAIANLFHVA